MKSVYFFHIVFSLILIPVYNEGGLYWCVRGRCVLSFLMFWRLNLLWSFITLRLEVNHEIFFLILQAVVTLHITITTAAILYPVLVILGYVLMLCSHEILIYILLEGYDGRALLTAMFVVNWEIL